MANNFACLKIGYLHDPTFVLIRTFTDIPCHLTCYYTDKPIRKHPQSRTIRGLTVPWGVYFCFTSYLSVEQTEIGDTLIHTFTIPNWPICEYRNFIFAGTIAGVESPSCSPIFSHHNSGWPPISLILRPYAPGDTCTIWSQHGDPCPNHWKNVDDIVPDEDLTCVFNDYPYTNWRRDLYHIPGLHPLSPILIKDLDLVGRFRRQGGYAYIHIARLHIKTHGVEYFGAQMNYFGEYYENRHWLLDTNPNTLLPWTTQEINDLQIGISLAYYRGIGWGSIGFCTQLYLQINFDFIME